MAAVAVIQRCDLLRNQPDQKHDVAGTQEGHADRDDNRGRAGKTVRQQVEELVEQSGAAIENDCHCDCDLASVQRPDTGEACGLGQGGVAGGDG